MLKKMKTDFSVIRIGIDGDNIIELKCFFL